MTRENEIKCNQNGNGSVLIAARPNRLRDSLYFLLKIVPGVNIVGLADDSSSALRMISGHHPALVVLDTNLPGDEAFTVLKRIKGNRSHSQCLVLADNVWQQRQAQATGADVALVKGYPAAKLFEIVEELLSK